MLFPFFFARLSCQFDVLLCVHFCRFAFGVFLCSFRFAPSPFATFASFAGFIWTLKSLVHAPFVLPSTSRPSVSPALLYRVRARGLLMLVDHRGVLVVCVACSWFACSVLVAFAL